MMQHLVYVVGPSGAGKDSVMQTLHAVWVDMPVAHWAQRSITRPMQADAEQHESLSESDFEEQLATDAFAMSWRANGLSYGIRHAQLAPLMVGQCVFVNGSRTYVPQVLRQWPDAVIVSITAPAEMLGQRLQTRAREDGSAIAKRLARKIELDLPPQAIEIINNGSLQDAAQQLLTELRTRWVHQPGGAA